MLLRLFLWERFSVPSRNVEKPTVPVVFKGPSLDRSSCPDRLLAAVGVD